MTSLNRPARLNRVLLLMTGLVMLAATAFVTGVCLQIVTAVAPGSALVPGTQLPPPWVLYVVAGAAVVVAGLAARWLLAQLARAPKSTTWHFGDDTGQTSLDPGAAVAPLLDEVKDLPGVADARGTLAGKQGSPTLALVITADQEGNPTEIRRHLAETALPRLRQALDIADLPTTVEFRFAARAPERVR
ncbi:hypothetical protein [Actinokineospora bangkokensis]|uniref:Alkaline shock response membrane anchor protein AmaP n=1 Tax=Actinokineospora bangkokensis TaxID=1193682 RepID=A0A1Q9LMQ9_9PSEU|nr:hypothetical protein [Actinokineospora bangkokensis]OLR93274.1 hypothetical protein BJP25_17485 [Actinokineospora bangkokensis]